MKRLSCWNWITINKATGLALAFLFSIFIAASMGCGQGMDRTGSDGDAGAAVSGKQASSSSVKERAVPANTATERKEPRKGIQRSPVGETNLRAKIRGLASSKNKAEANESIDSLTDIFEGGDNNHDLATRTLAAAALAELSKAEEDRAAAVASLEPLRKALFRDKSAVVRASAARSLGASGYIEFKSPLELAMKTDASLLVQTAASEALEKLTGETLVSPVEKALAESTIPTRRSLSSSVSSECIPRELFESLNEHLLILDPENAERSICK